MNAGLFVPVFAGVGGAAVAVSLGWRALALRDVGYRLEVRPDHVFPGDVAELVIELTNDKALPVPWLISRDGIPADLDVQGGRTEPHHLAGRAQLVQFWSVGARQRVRRRFRIRSDLRGRHLIGPTSLRAGDPFGWRDRMLESEVASATHLVVYPRLYPLQAWGLVADRPFGERPRPGWIFQDPAQVVGARPYEAGDPFRLIHWPATARVGSLQVKQTVPARSVAAALFLDVRTAMHPWEGVDRAHAEAAVSLAASLARQVVAAHGELALFSNAPLRDRANVVRLPPAAGTGQLLRVLQALALAGVQPWAHIETLLTMEGRALPRGVRILVVTPLLTPSVAAAVAALARQGRAVDLFRVGPLADAPLPALPQLRSFLVPSERVTAWFAEPVASRQPA